MGVLLKRVTSALQPAKKKAMLTATIFAATRNASARSGRDSERNIDSTSLPLTYRPLG
jgi:hypothetical protein